MCLIFVWFFKPLDPYHLNSAYISSVLPRETVMSKNVFTQMYLHFREKITVGKNISSLTTLKFFILKIFHSNVVVCDSFAGLVAGALVNIAIEMRTTNKFFWKHFMFRHLLYCMHSSTKLEIFENVFDKKHLNNRKAKVWENHFSYFTRAGGMQSREFESTQSEVTLGALYIYA